MQSPRTKTGCSMPGPQSAMPGDDRAATAASLRLRDTRRPVLRSCGDAASVFVEQPAPQQRRRASARRRRSPCPSAQASTAAVDRPADSARPARPAIAGASPSNSGRRCVSSACGGSAPSCSTTRVTPKYERGFAGRLLPRQAVVRLVAAERAELVGELRVVEHRHQLGIGPQARRARRVGEA